MYTIRQASARTGIAVPTIRAWERRYGVVRPARTASGYRLYDDAAIERLAAMQRLVANGWQPSVAAAALVNGSAPIAIAGDRGTTPTRTGGQSANDGEAAGIVARFVAAASALDEAELGRVLDDAFARGSFERVMVDLLFPALEALGDAWASGRVGVAGEHLASHAVLRRLAQAFDAAGAGDPDSPPVVVGLPPGSHHELGALAFAIALRRAGVPVAYLGPDLPAEDWVRASDGAAAAVIGVVTPRDRRAAADVVARLRRDRPGLLVALGGGQATRVPAVGLVPLPIELEPAVATVRDALGRRGSAAS